MFDQLLDDYREQHQEPTDHPDFEVLTQFAMDPSSVAQSQALIEHLDLCRSCGDIVLAVRQQQQGLPSDQGMAQEHAWLRYQYRYDPPKPETPDQDPVSPLLPGPSARPAFWARTGVAYALAAVLLLALLLQILRPTPNLELTSNLQYLSLAPISEASTSRSITSLPTGQTQRHLLLQLTTTNLHSYPSYEVEIQASSGKKWTTQLTRGPDGAFSLLIPAGTFERGTYQVKTAGLAQGVLKSLDTYELRLEDP